MNYGQIFGFYITLLFVCLVPDMSTRTRHLMVLGFAAAAVLSAVRIVTASLEWLT